MRRTALIACVSAITAACTIRWMDRHGWPAWWFIMALLGVAAVLIYLDVRRMDDEGP
jgi:predicted PurR-regulated permease PerM